MIDDSYAPRRASIEVRRAEATDELSVLVEARVRAGRDPWEFMEELPTVDELVVLTLCAEHIVEEGGRRPSPAEEDSLLRRLALQHPELTRAVWSLLDTTPGGRPHLRRRREAS